MDGSQQAELDRFLDASAETPQDAAHLVAQLPGIGGMVEEEYERLRADFAENSESH